MGSESVERNQLRYTMVISDGDAKLISRLNNEHPYGCDIVIQVITFMLLILFIFMVITYCFSTPSEDGVRGTRTETPREKTA